MPPHERWGRGAMRAVSRSLSALLAAAAALLLATSSTASWPQDQSGDERQRQLRRINAEIERLQGDISSLQSSEQTTIRRIEQLRLQRQIHLREIDSLEIEIGSAEERIVELEDTVSGIEISLRERRAELGRIVRRLYTSGRHGMLRVLLSVPQARQLGLAQAYLAAISEREMIFIQSYQADIAVLQGQRTELVRARTELEEMREAERRHAREAAEAEQDQERILDEIRNQGGIYQQALREKIAARQALEELIERVTRGEETAPHAPLSGMRGRLPWPCQGEVVARFGRIRDANYDVVLENDGIDIEAPTGTPVRAIYVGSVVFCDWIDERGNMVVLNHGNGYYSLYAHLERFYVALGDQVSAGQAIGTVGETGSLKGSILHFEIRRQAQALDPADWLTRQP